MSQNDHKNEKENDLEEDNIEIQEENQTTDITAADVRRGKDIQGISWEKLYMTREEFRQERLGHYTSFQNIPLSAEQAKKECKLTEKGARYYDFWRNTRPDMSMIVDLRLRNMIWSTSKHDVYLGTRHSIDHWSLLKSKKSEVLNGFGHVTPCEAHPKSNMKRLRPILITTMAVREKLLIAGGFHGELICKYMDRPEVCFCLETTTEYVGATNAVEIYQHPSGVVHFMASNEDGSVGDFDAERFQLYKNFCFPWSVNHISLNPDRKQLVIVGNNKEGILMDSESGKIITPLHGHLDYSYASAWHPNGQLFATGNQDKTCRIWDVRNLSKSVVALQGNMGAICAIRFTSDGQFMAMAESGDFVHVYDAKHGFENKQELDFFGEITGLSFSPDTEWLFIGVRDHRAHLLQYNRHTIDTDTME